MDTFQEHLQIYVRDTALFLRRMRDVMGVSPVTTTEQLLAVLEGYVASFGLPRTTRDEAD